MITIHFRKLNDAEFIYKRLLKQCDGQLDAISPRIIQKPEPLVKIEVNNETFIDSVLIPVLTSFIIRTIEGQWMKEMIKNMFYFTDVEEQEQIITIARSIIDGEKKGMPRIPELDETLPREKLIRMAFDNFITKNLSFSFESFLQFRLKDYRFRLLQYVETAIDEYKLEQEYQNFIENLRRFVNERKPILPSLHVFHDEHFLFYDHQIRIIPSRQLMNYIDERLLKIKDLDTESLVIAPLISIAPKTVHLYTDNMDHGMVQTIQNIFQERVIVHKKKAFKSEENGIINK